MTARRKAPALAAPATLEEAKALIHRYALLSAELDAITAETEAAIARARDAAAEASAPREAELRQLFAALKAWWAVAGAEIAGRRRSADLEGVEIGVRRTPPALKLPKGFTMPALIAAMIAKGHIGWLRVKHELDRAGIVATITGNPGRVLSQMGFEAVSKDEFYIALRPLDAAIVEEEL